MDNIKDFGIDTAGTGSDNRLWQLVPEQSVKSKMSDYDT
jgi:hypothetical protein